MIMTNSKKILILLSLASISILVPQSLCAMETPWKTQRELHTAFTEQKTKENVLASLHAELDKINGSFTLIVDDISSTKIALLEQAIALLQQHKEIVQCWIAATLNNPIITAAWSKNKLLPPTTEEGVLIAEKIRQNIIQFIIKTKASLHKQEKKELEKKSVLNQQIKSIEGEKQSLFARLKNIVGNLVRFSRRFISYALITLGFATVTIALDYYFFNGQMSTFIESQIPWAHMLQNIAQAINPQLAPTPCPTCTQCTVVHCPSCRSCVLF